MGNDLEKKTMTPRRRANKRKKVIKQISASVEETAAALDAKESADASVYSGRGRTLEDHPLFEEMYEMMRYHFSPETVWSLIRHRYGDEYQGVPLPSQRTLYRWRESYMPDTELLPTRLVFRRLEGVAPKVDLHSRLTQLYEESERRLQRINQLEENMGGVPIPGFERAMEVHLRLSEHLWKIAQDLGMAPRLHTGPAVQVGVFVGGGPTKPQVARDEVGTDEQMAAADALFRAKFDRDPPDIEGEVISRGLSQVAAAVEDIVD